MSVLRTCDVTCIVCVACFFPLRSVPPDSSLYIRVDGLPGHLLCAVIWPRYTLCTATVGTILLHIFTCEKSYILSTALLFDNRKYQRIVGLEARFHNPTPSPNTPFNYNHRTCMKTGAGTKLWNNLLRQPCQRKWFETALLSPRPATHSHRGDVEQWRRAVFVCALTSGLGQGLDLGRLKHWHPSHVIVSAVLVQAGLPEVSALRKLSTWRDLSI